MGVTRVGNSLAKEALQTNIRNLTLQESLMCVGIVAKHLFTNLSLFDTRDLTLGRSHLSASNVGFFFVFSRNQWSYATPETSHWIKAL